MTEDDEATITPTAHAYAELQKWMVGARVDSVKQDGGTWVCQLSRDGATSWIVWNPDHNANFDRPKDADTIRKLSGDRTGITGSRIEIGATPVLLEKAAH
jgi:hypothetical protein